MSLTRIAMPGGETLEHGATEAVQEALRAALGGPREERGAGLERRVHAEPTAGLRREDGVVSLVGVGPEDGPFGSGEARFAKEERA